MVEVIPVLIGISFILFFGYFAEFLFKKIHVPDVLLLILLGIVMGPFVLKYISPAAVASYAPVFTTFALLFLLYDGAFNINLASFAKGFVKSLNITLFNFILSAAVITCILYIVGLPILYALLTGFILGGVSSAFVIPLLKQLNIKGKIYSVLTLESALTDVFCIVFALATIEIIQLGSVSAQAIVVNIISLFAIAGFIGVIAGIIWMVIVLRFFKGNKFYMLTVAYLIFLYVITELMQGNGAIAALFFGLVIRNSKQITVIFNKFILRKVNFNAVAVASKEEEVFYAQLTFFLKTFFFVYVGVLIDFSDITLLLIGAGIAVALMLTRMLSRYIITGFEEKERQLVTAIFARGLAAAAIAQIVLQMNLAYASTIAGVTYSAIFATIVLSSLRVFFHARTATATPLKSRR
ncbi:MAG: cation:proton antiporter [archaeon]